MAARSRRRASGLRSFRRRRSDITSGVSATAISFLFPQPAGAFVSPLLAPLIQQALAYGAIDFTQRQMSGWQQERVRDTLLLAADKIVRKLNQGYQERSDAFFVRQIGQRPLADEILEGVLLAAQEEHEQSKIPFIANLLANLFFAPDVNRAQANVLIRLANNLSFAQLVIIKIFSEKDKYIYNDVVYIDSDVSSENTFAIITEIHDLLLREMLAVDEGQFVASTTDVSLINPAKMIVVGLARTLYRMMELRDISEEHVAEIADLLRW